MRFLSALMLLSICTVSAHSDDFFNLKDLSGWQGLKEHWSVKDGMIHGTTQPKGINFNTFLCSEKEYTDFELKLQVKLTPNGNSGVQIRSKIDEKEKFVVGGPQCDMGQQYWGSLYGERFGGMMKSSDAPTVKNVVKVGEFNDYYILCKGKHVTIRINGTTMLDGDFPKMPDKGIIAFQIHGGGAMDVYFKNIEFKDLTNPPATAASTGSCSASEIIVHQHRGLLPFRSRRTGR